MVPGIYSRENISKWRRRISSKYERIFQVGEHVWAHLFTHLLATKSEEANDEFDLMYWFDWSRYETVKRYVKLGEARESKE